MLQRLCARGAGRWWYSDVSVERDGTWWMLHAARRGGPVGSWCCSGRCTWWPRLRLQRRHVCHHGARLATSTLLRLARRQPSYRRADQVSIAAQNTAPLFITDKLLLKSLSASIDRRWRRTLRSLLWAGERWHYVWLQRSNSRNYCWFEAHKRPNGVKLSVHGFISLILNT